MNEIRLFVQSIRIRHNTHPHGKHNKSQKQIFAQHDTEIHQLILCTVSRCFFLCSKKVSEKMSQKDLEDDFNDLEQQNSEISDKRRRVHELLRKLRREVVTYGEELMEVRRRKAEKQNICLLMKLPILSNFEYKYAKTN